MTDGLKTYDEIVDAARTQFSPDARHFRDPRTMEAPLVTDLAVLLGYTRDLDRTHEQQYSETTSFVGRAGVKSFARSIAFFGYFDGSEEFKAVPWTNHAVSHHTLWVDLHDQASDVRTAGYPELVGGYSAHFENGATVVYHTGRNILDDEVRMRALRDATVLLPDVEQVLEDMGTRVHLSP